MNKRLKRALTLAEWIVEFSLSNLKFNSPQLTLALSSTLHLKSSTGPSRLPKAQVGKTGSQLIIRLNRLRAPRRQWGVLLQVVASTVVGHRSSIGSSPGAARGIGSSFVPSWKRTKSRIGRRCSFSATIFSTRKCVSCVHTLTDMKLSFHVWFFSLCVGRGSVGGVGLFVFL